MRNTMLAAGLATLFAATAADATTIVKPPHSLLGSFVGTATPELTIDSFTVNLTNNDSVFNFSATLDGPLVASDADIYVIGVDTGTGTARPFGDIGEGNVAFNQAIVFRENTCGASLTTCTAALGANTFNVAISGANNNTFSFSVAANLLPSTGFATRDDLFNLWSRVALVKNSDNADFAPDNALFSATPEPTSWILMIGGFGAVGATLRRRRAAVTA